MTWRARAPFDGVRTALRAFPTHTVSRILPSPSGTERSKFSPDRYKSLLLTRTSDFLKERLFGLSNPQGNHGESLKECHFHLDNTPTVR